MAALADCRAGSPRVVVLMEYLWPSRARIFEILQDQVGQLHLLCSVDVGENRLWAFRPGTLSVLIQHTIVVASRWRHPLGFSDDNHVRFPLDTIPLLYRLCPDVVISQQLGFRSLCGVLYCAVRRRCRLILWLQMTEHQQRGRRPLRKALRYLLFKRADHVITNGPSCGRYVRTYGYPPERMTEIQTACDVSGLLARTRGVQWNGRKRLLYVGRLVSGKGLLGFLDLLELAVSEINGVQVEFAIVGYGALENKLRGWRSGCGRVQIRLLGPVDVGEHPEIYQEGDAFVFPTLSDEWGVVVNEAMASGLPVLGSLYSQAVEVLVKDGVNGLTFTPGSEEALERVKRFLSLSAVDVARMGAAARRTISSLTVERAAALHLSVIRSVVKDRRP